ncbi:MAG: tyrosine-protein phosphatase [Oscillospiraceae bacterium]|nr:tyrosine-protein phosphatase [Oscillospiraceae bacterium]
MEPIISTYLPVEGLSNTRDLGGMRTADGHTIRRGRLFRSGKLDNLKDPAWLSEHVSLIVDFRSTKEKDDHPEPVAAGVEYLHIPLFERRTSGVTRDKESDRGIAALDPESALARMAGVYRSFLTDEFSLSQYRRFMHLLLEDREKAVLWHCSAGKDRTGTGALFVQALLGVSREDILADYTSSNIYLEPEIRQQIADRAAQTGSMDETQEKIMRCFIGAHEEYPQMVFRTADELYGSFDGFIRDGLQITDSECETFRKLYLE